MKYFLIFSVIFILFGGLNYFVSRQIILWFKNLLPGVKSLYIGIIYGVFIFFMILGMILSMANISLPLSITRFFAILIRSSFGLSAKFIKFSLFVLSLPFLKFPLLVLC